VLVLVLDAAIEVSGADRGFIMLASPGGNDGKLEFTVGRGRGRISLEGQTFKISRKIPEDVFARGESRIVADLVEDDAADTHMATVALGIRQVLCVPLKLMRFLDQPGAAPVRDPRPDPIEIHRQSVPRADEEEEMNDAPQHPGDEALQLDPVEVGDRRRASNHGELSGILVYECRRRRASRYLRGDHLGDMSSLLFGDRSDTRQSPPVFRGHESDIA